LGGVGRSTGWSSAGGSDFADLSVMLSRRSDLCGEDEGSMTGLVLETDPNESIWDSSLPIA